MPAAGAGAGAGRLDAGPRRTAPREHVGRAGAQGGAVGQGAVGQGAVGQGAVGQGAVGQAPLILKVDTVTWSAYGRIMFMAPCPVDRRRPNPVEMRSIKASGDPGEWPGIASPPYTFHQHRWKPAPVARWVARGAWTGWTGSTAAGAARGIACDAGGSGAHRRPCTARLQIVAVESPRRRLVICDRQCKASLRRPMV